LSALSAKIIYINKKKEGWHMSIKTYSIETLLEGKVYRSHNRRGLEGIIQNAEKRSSVWCGENFEAYTIQVRPQYSSTSGNTLFNGKDFYATIAVKVGE
jgi:hypothetical protein